jgi:hypothetical protein
MDETGRCRLWPIFVVRIDSGFRLRLEVVVNDACNALNRVIAEPADGGIVCAFCYSLVTLGLPVWLLVEVLAKSRD